MGSWGTIPESHGSEPCVLPVTPLPRVPLPSRLVLRRRRRFHLARPLATWVELHPLPGSGFSKRGPCSVLRASSRLWLVLLLIAWSLPSVTCTGAARGDRTRCLPLTKRSRYPQRMGGKSSRRSGVSRTLAVGVKARCITVLPRTPRAPDWIRTSSLTPTKGVFTRMNFGGVSDGFATCPGGVRAAGGIRTRIIPILSRDRRPVSSSAWGDMPVSIRHLRVHSPARRPLRQCHRGGGRMESNHLHRPCRCASVTPRPQRARGDGFDPPASGGKGPTCCITPSARSGLTARELHDQIFGCQ